VIPPYTVHHLQPYSASALDRAAQPCSWRFVSLLIAVPRSYLDDRAAAVAALCSPSTRCSFSGRMGIWVQLVLCPSPSDALAALQLVRRRAQQSLRAASSCWARLATHIQFIWVQAPIAWS
jgi:hypothetical protein